MELLQNAAQNFTNEQMAQVKQGYQMGLQLIYDKQVFSGMMQDLQQVPPEQGLAQAVVTVMMKVQEQVGDLDMLTATALGISLLGEVADAVAQAGMQLDQEQQTAAFEVAVQMWLSANAGKMNQQEVAAAMQQMSGGQAQQTPQQPQQQTGGLLEGISR